MRTHQPFSWRLTVMTGMFLGSMPYLISSQAVVFDIPSGDVTALIAAIHTANGNGEDDTISLAAGTYTLTKVDNDTNGPNGLPSIMSTMTIRSVNAKHTMIERDASAPPFRIFHVSSAGHLVLDNVTLKGGHAHNRGGGIANFGTLMVTHSTVSDNSSEDHGGGISNVDGEVTISHSTISKNVSGSQGGGIDNDGGSLLVEHSIVSANHAGLFSGGLATVGGGFTEIGHSTISDNSANVETGGIGSDNTETLIMNSTVSGNSSPAGGGMTLENGASRTILNVTIANNYAWDSPSSGIWFSRTGSNALLQNTVVDDDILIEDGNTLDAGATLALAATEGFGSCEGKPQQPLPLYDHSQVGYRRGAAIPNRAGTMTFPAGRHTISAQIILQSGDVLRGAGQHDTVLYFPTGLKQMGITCRDGTMNNRDCFDWPALKNMNGLYMGVIGLKGSSIGVRDLTIEFPSNHAWTHYAGYDVNSGYNGFELQDCTNCWIKNVTIKNADNGIMINRGRNSTLEGVHVYARPGGGHMHIGYSSGTKNNLTIDFRVYGRSAHGLTMNWGTENNVFANGWGENIRVEPDHNCNGSNGTALCSKYMLYSNIAGKISSLQVTDRAGNLIPVTLWNVGFVDRCPLDAYTAQRQ